MKRLAFWIVLGVVVLNVAGRRHRDRAWGDGPGRMTTPVPGGAWADRPSVPVTTVSDDVPAPTPPTPPAKARRGQAPAKAKPAPPRPPAPPAVAEPRRQPDWFPKDRDEEEARARTTDARGMRVLVGPISATESKARDELSTVVRREVAAWLGGDFRWKRPPAPDYDALVRDLYVQPVAESLGDVSKDLDDVYTLYRAGAKVDFSDAAKVQLIKAHDRILVRDRIFQAGAVLAFVLFALAALAGYIRTDEATKGSYTNRLRMLTAAGVGAAGVAVYQMLA